MKVLDAEGWHEPNQETPPPTEGVSPREAKRHTALHWAVDRADLTDIVQLIAEGVPVNAPSTDGVTPLHWAVHYQGCDVVRLLLEHGADPNARTDRGHTPLHWAVLRDPLLLMAGEDDRPQIISLLLAHGADTSAETDSGKTALHVAEASEFPSDEVTSLLRSR